MELQGPNRANNHGAVRLEATSVWAVCRVAPCVGCVRLYIYIYIHTHIHAHTCICMCTYIYIYSSYHIPRERKKNKNKREGEREREREGGKRGSGRGREGHRKGEGARARERDRERERESFFVAGFLNMHMPFDEASCLPIRDCTKALCGSWGLRCSLGMLWGFGFREFEFELCNLCRLVQSMQGLRSLHAFVSQASC